MMRAPRMLRLDCEPHQEATMPHFADVLALVGYFMQGGAAEEVGGKRRELVAPSQRCMFLEQSGRMDTLILLVHLLTRADSL